jgi:UDP-GlcNAc:undecaprenyl-phosphate GlcNAc-1-phosphate transferase
VVHALPFFAALIAGALMAPATFHTLASGGYTRANYRDRELPFPFGVMVVGAALLALVPLALAQELAGARVFHPETAPILVYALGVAFLGLVDDTLSASARGWRGHAGTVLHGGFSTGALKAAGSLGLALFVMSGRGLSAGRYLLASAVLVLATNVFNLLDLRPGRSIKAFVALGAGLSLGVMDVRPLWALGLFVAPVLVAGLYDVRERAMLGDTGSNLVGALAGLWLVLSLSGTGQAVAAGVLAVITIYGEFRSISDLVARTPGLRALDSWGRP